MFVGFEGFFGGGHRKSIEHVNFKGSKKNPNQKYRILTVY